MLRRTLSAAVLLVAACGAEERPPTAAHPPEDALAHQQREVGARYGVPTTFVNDLGMRFVLVPPGSFSMGSPASEGGRHDDEVEHEVETFSPYYVQAEEVGDGALAAWRPGRTGGAGLSHDESREFAAWLSARDGTWNYRLPTEAEWERAARGAEALGIHATTDARWEWCADWYEPYPDYRIQDPLGPPNGEERALRGGSRRVAERMHAPPSAVPSSAGVRLAASLPYAKADMGSCTVTFRSVEPGAEGLEPQERPGYDVRLISVFDRLSSRQMQRELPWTVISARHTPFEWRLPPGRYYAQAQEPGDPERRGPEMKIYLDLGTMPAVQFVDLPVPHDGRLLTKPQ